MIDEPPIADPLTDETGKANLSWVNFFLSVSEGDYGIDWLPNFVNLSVSGAPSISGRYFQLSNQIAVFWVKVIPGTNTSSTAGVTYIDNFPLLSNADGVCFAVAGGGAEVGMIEAATNRIYPPTWSAVTVPLTVIGLAFAGET